ncbi:protein of unknown function DUF1385 [Candidatus Koribacter versatilis Ellin345]|uniref:DUF1385 domain-containing protein n=1 Tax=Koribacter versatilis (strain Ellin345) TaxID=204669 RepID=Q1II27_KORVE|nr:DUF1385 domain-containing protein [Candidatus Koribacter versatilis]ABF43473.1 protein of unknown function DUF1385 [Candidatus Koribacter versatilis Ellin345]
MRSQRHWFRFMTAVQLLPALESGEETLVGGQAVLEGVMMRSPHAFSIAVRNPQKQVVHHTEPIERLSEKHKWMGWPFLRGVMTLGQAIALGFKALKFSANVALAEEGEEQKSIESNGWAMALNVILSLGFFIFMYKFLPLLGAKELKHVNPVFGHQIWFNVADGVIRIAIFLLFIWATSLMKDLHRVYEYHGAEHKTVFAFENHDPLTNAEVQKYSTYHPRCGTSFLMTVMLISMVVYLFIPVSWPLWGRFLMRVALLPFIAGTSYEIIRFAAKRKNALFTLLTLPGMWLQRITTQPPDDSQVECAISALDQAMELEKQRGGELVIG